MRTVLSCHAVQPDAMPVHLAAGRSLVTRNTVILCLHTCCWRDLPAGKPGRGVQIKLAARTGPAAAAAVKQEEAQQQQQPDG